MFWDKVAGLYGLFVNVFNRKVHAALKEYVAGLMDASDTVLECACGSGMLTQVIAPKCAHITATDFSRKMLEQTSKTCRAFSNVTVEFADITGLQYPDAVYDKVVAANVIHLLDDPGKALHELYRVTKPGGFMIIPTYMNRRDGGTSVFAKVVGKAGAGFKRQFTPESYRAFFEKQGYKIVETRLFRGRVPCQTVVIKKAESSMGGQRAKRIKR